MSVAGVHSDHSAATALVGDDIRSCERVEACGCSAVEVFITSYRHPGCVAASWQALRRKVGPNRKWAYCKRFLQPSRAASPTSRTRF